jgi:hypothetical protein
MRFILKKEWLLVIDIVFEGHFSYNQTLMIS